jgi:iron complex transport system permease protein
LEKTLWALLLLSATAAGLAVTFNGLIPFVGLLVPAMARAWTGGDHRRALPLSLYLGAILAMTADALGRWALAPREIPAGVVTALAGAPVFFVMIRRAKEAS